MTKLLELLDRLDALEGEATPGPWDSYPVLCQDFRALRSDGLHTLALWIGQAGTPETETNVQLTEKLRNAYPLLSRALRAALAYVDQAEMRGGGRPDIRAVINNRLKAIEAELSEAPE